MRNGTREAMLVQVVPKMGTISPDLEEESHGLLVINQITSAKVVVSTPKYKEFLLINDSVSPVTKIQLYTFFNIPLGGVGEV